MTATDAVLSGFEQLPDVFFTEQDTGKIAEAVILIYESLTKQVLYPGDPVRLFLYTLAAVIAQRNIILDQTGKMNLLRYAKGDFLDHLGAMLDVPRLEKKFAETTERFAIASPVDYPVLVPAGTRVTPDSKFFFATTEVAILSAGESYVDIPIKALTAGTAGNGLVAGQVNKLVDPLPVVVSVANTKITSGGSEVEQDEPYRLRIHLAPERFTCAGSELAYEFFARSAHPNISDVKVTSPVPGVVHVYVLLQGGVLPDPDGPEIKAVVAALSPKKVRPLTDHVFVLVPEAVSLDYRFTYYLTKLQAGYADAIDSNLRLAAAAYETWQTGRVGRDIIPDELIRLCRAAGAKRIVPELVTRNQQGAIVSAVPLDFTPLADRQIAVIPPAEGRVVCGGIEEE